MSVTEEVLRKWANRWHSEDGHVQLLSSEESAHVLLDLICEKLKVPKNEPKLLLKEIDFMSRSFYRLIQSEMNLDLVKKATRSANDVELLEKIVELTGRNFSYQPEGVYRHDFDDEGQFYVFRGRCHCGNDVWNLSKFCDQCGQRLLWEQQ